MGASNTAVPSWCRSGVKESATRAGSRNIDYVVRRNRPRLLPLAEELEAGMETKDPRPGSQTRQVVSSQSVWASMT